MTPFDPSQEIVLSVCDHSGQWSRTYTEMGYRVLRIDPKHGPDVDQLGRGITEEPAFTGPGSVMMEDDGEGWPMTSGLASKLLRADPSCSAIRSSASSWPPLY